MAGEIQAKGLALAGETHRLAPLRQRRYPLQLRKLGSLRAREPEQVVLTGLMGAAPLVAELHRGSEAVHERGTVGAEPIEAARAQERLEHAAVDLLQVEPPAQILEALIGAVRLALRDECFHCATADPAHGAEPIADAVLAAGGELVARGVYIR